MLLFQKRFLDMIRSGQKTQTIRVWKYQRMRAGQRSYIPGVGYIQIDQVDPIRLTDLTEEDAQRDGFPTAGSLRQEIIRLYSKQLNQGEEVYRVRFTVLPAEQQQAIRREKAARKERARRGESGE